MGASLAMWVRTLHHQGYTLMTTDGNSNALFVPSAAHPRLTSSRLDCHDYATNGSRRVRRFARLKGFEPELPLAEYVDAARRVIDGRCRATNTPYTLSW